MIKTIKGDTGDVRRLWYGMVISLLMLGGLSVTRSPYLRLDGGPVIRVGRPVHGSWSVSTARARRSTWFQWGMAELAGGRTVRGGAGAPDQSMVHAMDTSQTYAALVAAQLAARRAPDGGGGLQVAGNTESVRAAGLRPGDVLLSAGDSHDMTALRARTDLQQAAAARRGDLSVLVVPKISGNAWGNAEIRRMPAAALAEVPAGPAISAVAYPLKGVQGPSAGLILTLARVDELTSGELAGGRSIAGTGTIGLDGAVGGVGEVTEKVHAAVAARMEVFFVPIRQRGEADRAARGGRTRVVPVRSASEAIAWLCATGGRAPLC